MGATGRGKVGLQLDAQLGLHVLGDQVKHSALDASHVLTGLAWCSDLRVAGRGCFRCRHASSVLEGHPQQKPHNSWQLHSWSGAHVAWHCCSAATLYDGRPEFSCCRAGDSILHFRHLTEEKLLRCT